MIKYIPKESVSHRKSNWIEVYDHVSFSYNSPKLIQMLSDAFIMPNEGFDMHPHDNMEVVTYVIEGHLTHSDSLNNTGTLTKGQVQYMSSGTGISHSEHNFSDKILHHVQIWVSPDKKGHTPAYGDHKLPWEPRIGKWMPIFTGTGGDEFPIHLHADVNMYVTELEEGNETTFKIDKNRQAYLMLPEGRISVNNITMDTSSALEIVEEDIKIKANEKSHIVLFEMKK